MFIREERKKKNPNKKVFIREEGKKKKKKNQKAVAQRPRFAAQRTRAPGRAGSRPRPNSRAATGSHRDQVAARDQVSFISQNY